MTPHGSRTDSRSPVVGEETDERTLVERLVATYADLVLRVAYARLGSFADAQDICQTVFLKLLILSRKGLARFNDTEHEKAWVVRTAINACIDLLRRESSRAVVSLDGNMGELASGGLGDAEDGTGGIDDEACEVLDAVNALPPLYRQAVYLHYYEGYSVKEISTMTGETPGTVRKHLSRARAKLRPILEGGER